MLKPGDLAPDFECPDESGTPIRLSDCLRRGPVVLYFYPADHTPVCTAEACLFRDHRAEFQALGAQIIGVSPQSAESKRRFAQAHSLGFPLIADPDRTLARLYRLGGFLGLPIPFGVRRVTYLIGQDGRIRDAAAAEFRLKAHEQLMDRALNFLRASQPAKTAP